MIDAPASRHRTASSAISPAVQGTLGFASRISNSFARISTMSFLFRGTSFTRVARQQSPRQASLLRIPDRPRRAPPRQQHIDRGADVGRCPAALAVDHGAEIPALLERDEAAADLEHAARDMARA